MSGDTMPTFDTKDRQRVYEFIAKEGPVSLQELEEADLVSVTPDRYRKIVAILKRDGYITEVEGMIRDDYGSEVAESHALDDVDFRVRKARLEDLSGLAGVIRQVIEGETYIVGESVSDQLSNVDSILHGDSGTIPIYFVALVDGEVIGWVQLNGKAAKKLDHVVYLTMGLLDEYRGLGIGERLMNRAITWADEYGYRKVASNIPATNDSAIEFLEENGWEQVGVRPNHYEIDGTLVDEVLLDRIP